MLPGNANKDPVPIKFLNKEMQNAFSTPYHGPNKTADNTLMVCCMGKHFDAPMGIKIIFPAKTPIAINIAEMVSFFVFTCIPPLGLKNKKSKAETENPFFALPDKQLCTLSYAGITQIRFKG